MNILRLTSIAALTFAAFTANSRASLADFTDYSLGGTVAGWDIYYGANYLPTFEFLTGTAGNPITNSPSNLSLIADIPNWIAGPNAPYTGHATGPTGSDGATIPGDRELFYTFFASPVNFSINSIAMSDTDTFVFQALTSSGSAGGLTNILLNGIAATTTGTNGAGVSFWSWSGLDFDAGTTLSLTYSAATQHSSFDAFQIQSDSVLTAVPEPSVTAIGVLAAMTGIVAMRRRRRQA